MPRRNGVHGRGLRVALVLTSVCTLVAAFGLWRATVAGLRPVPSSFAEITAGIERLEVTDRHGRALNATYANDWNLHRVVPLHQMPTFLIEAVLTAEDKRFFDHGGADWLARLRAAAQNALALRAVSGASTISEQVVRMIHPRPRTLWSRWLEGFEAGRLERAHGKLAVLEFYLNQVPYAANRRGVAQAAHHYFDRDLDTLAPNELLTLAVLVRAPSRLDPLRGDEAALSAARERLVTQLLANSTADRAAGIALTAPLALRAPALSVDARHFLDHVLHGGAAWAGEVAAGHGDGQAAPSAQNIHRLGHEGAPARLTTTLDAALQARLQGLLDERLRALAGSRVHNAGLLVADHRSGEVLAWVVGGANDAAVPGRLINAVVTPRQPGSALKPFLYALALEKGWTAATLIDDAPLAEMVGVGLHSYSNYSRTFHGPLTLRNALGNSLNIPAVRTIQFTGAAAYLELLENLGFETLARHPDFYGDGLALGNGEVTLLELVGAYAALANRGVYRPFATRADDVGLAPRRRVLSAEAASLIGHILSDPEARQLEFGRGSLLNLPLQTAVKTGTSSDYRDSWAVGYDDGYVVGAWMGNLDQTPTRGVTGSTGPALVLRGAFDLLGRHRETRPLWLSPRLTRAEICAETGTVVAMPGRECRRRSEYFLAGTVPDAGPVPGGVPQTEGAALDGVSEKRRSAAMAPRATGIRLRQPTPGLHLALDPRVPADLQAFEFVLDGVAETDRVVWRIDGRSPVTRQGARYVWPLQRGSHVVSAEIHRDTALLARLDSVEFLVK